MAEPREQILLEVAQGVLHVASELFALNPFSRAVVTPGPPAWDCEQLTVHISRVYNAGPFTEIRTRPVEKHAVPTAEVVVTALRCVTSLTEQGESPSAATVNAEGEQGLVDGELLYYGLLQAIAAGGFPDGVNCPSVRVERMVAVGPQGGLGGWELTLTMTL